LAERSIVSTDTIEWLANYQFSGTIRGYAEGELYFPHSPILQVEGTFADAVVLETLILSVLNHDCAVAAAASRMVNVAGGRPLIEMGSRRTGEHSAWAAARAAYLVGFSHTSNLEAGMRFGIPTLGTAAHAFTLVHDSEAEAFSAQIRTFGPGTTLLIDTFDIPTAVKNAVDIAGPELGAVRIDSGDLSVVVRDVRKQLDALGAKTTRIVVTNDLDEYAIAALQASPVDAYGVGTSVVTGSGHPAAGLVYKLVARESDQGEWVSVHKTSPDKANPGGEKTAVRVIEAGQATKEYVGLTQGDTPIDGRNLLIDYVVRGTRVSTSDSAQLLRAGRDRHLESIAELPADGLRLTKGEPALETVFSLD
jgi:nicotinate phosphoribosyltransferase